jgi:hypothetical protein
MSALREAIVLPLIFLTATLLSAAEFGARTVLAPPSLFALVLATMLLAALIRGRALAPERLLHNGRPMLANGNGAIVLLTLFYASAQVLAMLTPKSGLPLFFVDVLLFVLLLNTLVAQPERARLLRSVAVTLGSALILKFVVLAGLSQPSGTRMSRVLVALFDAATFGAIAQDPQPAAAGYAAFAAVALYLVGLALLAHASPPAPPVRRAELTSAPPVQSIEA